jgi:small subunit ribosomal protein S1
MRQTSRFWLNGTTRQDPNMEDRELDNPLQPNPLLVDSDDEAEAEEDFARLLEESLQSLKRFSRGEKVRGRIVGMNDEWIFLDLGTKEQGIIAATELTGGPDAKPPAVGEWLEAHYLEEQEGEIRLTTRLGGQDVSKSLLEDAYRGGIPVEGTVSKETKGGFEVQIGTARCFCPYSQIDAVRQDASAYVGQTLSFLIIDFAEGGRNIVVSRRQLLEVEKQERYEQLKATLQVGAVVQGEVRALEPFGAFIDMGGVDGLVPLSELSWGHVADASEVLTPGQTVEVQLVDLDWERKRITLSLKRLTPNPWTRVHELLAEGQVVSGRVRSLKPYGAFVELIPGIEGLIHVSRLASGRRINHPREVVTEGDPVQVRIETIDAENQRLSLSLETTDETPTASADVPHSGATIQVGAIVRTVVEAAKPFGVLARLPDGRIGLIPNSELLTPQGAVLRRHYKPGQPLTVQVLDITEAGKRLRLSERAAQNAGEVTEAASYMAQHAPKKSGGLGTLADLLRKPRES